MKVRKTKSAGRASARLGVNRAQNPFASAPINVLYRPDEDQVHFPLFNLLLKNCHYLIWSDHCKPGCFTPNKKLLSN